MLRRAGEQVQDTTRRVTASDLSNTEMIQAAPEANSRPGFSCTGIRPV